MENDFLAKDKIFSTPKKAFSILFPSKVFVQDSFDFVRDKNSFVWDKNSFVWYKNNFVQAEGWGITQCGT